MRNEKPVKCTRCDGCGQLADTKDEEPWTAWTSLPLHSAAGVLSGLVKPKLCPACGGKGVVMPEYF
jgi:DnaJ-class molecular chaperone